MCVNTYNRSNAQPPPELAKGKQRERETRGYWEGQQILTPTFVRSSNQMANKRRLHTVYACKLKIPHQLISGAAAYWAVCAPQSAYDLLGVDSSVTLTNVSFRSWSSDRFISNISSILFCRKQVTCV